MPLKPRTRKNGPTLKDVAAEAGVSIAAASKVLHGRGANIRVSPEKAESIQTAAKDLNYVPNALAQSMRLGRTGAVGLVFENFGRISGGPLFYVHLFDGVVGELFPKGYRLTIYPEVDPLSPLGIVSDGSVDGVVWCKMPETHEFTEAAKQSPVPIVALNSRPPESPDHVTYVSCDNLGGSSLMVEHLTSLGHERILFAMERREERTPDALSRLAGFQAACHRMRVPFENEKDVVVWSQDAAELPIWLKERPPHTAIFAWNEGFGASVLRQLLACGVRVPDEMSVAGFDSTQFCDALTPSLTAVRQPVLEMASYATRLLLEQIAEGRNTRSPDVIFPCSLDVRESTGPAPLKRRSTAGGS